MPNTLDDIEIILSATLRTPKPCKINILCLHFPRLAARKRTKDCHANDSVPNKRMAFIGIFTGKKKKCWLRGEPCVAAQIADRIVSVRYCSWRAVQHQTKCIHKVYI